eukprot:6201213-Karenia_brevis.AAC.1
MESRQGKFVSFHALLFGQTAAVNNFNRAPALVCAAASRIAGCMVLHYFGAFGCLDFEAHSSSECSAQQALGTLAEGMGFP